VRRCEDRLLEWLSLAAFFHIVGPKGGVMFDNVSVHQRDHSSKMPVVPLRYPAAAFELV
jgi:hypothetical protein